MKTNSDKTYCLYKYKNEIVEKKTILMMTMKVMKMKTQFSQNNISCTIFKYDCQFNDDTT